MSWPSPEFLEIEPEPFSPYIFVATSEKMPSSIAMAAVAAAGMKYILLPSRTSEVDLPMIQERVRRHYLETKGGNVPLFGRATGYLFVFSPTEGILLGPNGAELGRRTGRFHPRSISIQDLLTPERCSG